MALDVSPKLVGCGKSPRAAIEGALKQGREEGRRGEERKKKYLLILGNCTIGGNTTQFQAMMSRTNISGIQAKSHTDNMTHSYGHITSYTGNCKSLIRWSCKDDIRISLIGRQSHF